MFTPLIIHPSKHIQRSWVLNCIFQLVALLFVTTAHASVFIPADQGWDANHSKTASNYQFHTQEPEAYCLATYQHFNSVGLYINNPYIGVDYGNDGKDARCLVLSRGSSHPIGYMSYRWHCPFGTVSKFSPQLHQGYGISYSSDEVPPNALPSSTSRLWISLPDDPGLQCELHQEYYIAEPTPETKSCEGNPCNPATGNKIQVETDLSLPEIGLVLQRTYQSQNIDDSYFRFGENWRHNYARRVDQYNQENVLLDHNIGSQPIKSQLYATLQEACETGWNNIKATAFTGKLSDTTAVINNGVCDLQRNAQVVKTLPVQQTQKFPVNSAALKSVSRPDGAVHTFRENNGNWESLSPTKVGFVNTADGWEFTDSDGKVEEYDVSGRLQTSTATNGWVTTLGYDGVGRLITITGPFGHQLTFQYYNNASGYNKIWKVTTPLGDITYGYDANNNLSTVTYPDSHVKTYHYENTSFPHHLTGITDENGIRYATWAYDTEGRAILSEHAGGAEKVTFVFNGDGTTTVTDSHGSVRDYQFEMAGGQLQVDSLTGVPCLTCGNGQMKARDYDAEGNLIEFTDWEGMITQFGNYDAKGQYAYKIEAVGTPEERRMDYTYDSRFFNKIETITEPSVHSGSNKVTTYTYDALGNRTSETITGFDLSGAAVSRTTTWQYNGPLNQLSFTDGPRTDVNDYTYYRYYPNDPAEGNNRSRLKEVEDATGVRDRFNIQYSATGKVLSEQHPNNVTVTYTYYPGNDRLETLTESGGSDTRVTHWTYLPTGEVETLTQGFSAPEAVTLTFGYDDARRLDSITDAFGNHIDYTLDTEGNHLEEKTFDANGALTQQLNQTFDLYNRLATYTQANASGSQVHHADGTLDNATDGNGSTTQHDYDALKRLIQTTQDLGGTDPATADIVTGFDYDVSDRLTTVTDANGNATIYDYDDLGNLLTQTSPDTGITAFGYDDAGNRMTETDARGITVTYTYDALNRLTKIDYPGTDLDVTFKFDQGSNRIGRLAWINDASGNTTYIYNPLGDILQLRRTIDGEVYRTQYSYNATGQVFWMRLSSDRTVGLQRNETGQIKKVTTTYEGIWQAIANNITYLPFGGVDQFTFGNGLVYDPQYALDYRMTDQTLGSVFDRDYSYGLAGNLTGIDDLIDNTLDQIFGYDALDQLIDEIASTTQSYEYDGVGNRTKRIYTWNTAYQYEANSNLLSTIGNQAAQTYDAVGNTLTARNGNYSYTYNDAGRLTNVIKNGITRGTYTHNGLGQRTKKQTFNTGGVLTATFLYFYDLDGSVESEIRFNNLGVKQHITDYLWLNDQPIFQGRGYLNAQGDIYKTDAYYLHTDHLNTPRLATDGNQTIVWRWNSDSFGNGAPDIDPDGDTNNVNINLRFPGQYYDGESQLHYNYFRYYEPATGRYVTSDPIGLDGGMNTYAYVGGNPTNYVDPTGESALAGALPVAGGLAAVDGPLPIGDLIGVGILGAAVIYDMCSSDTEECEKQCDLEWDRNKVMCDADAAMKGYNSKRYLQCMEIVDKIYIDCIATCN